MKPIAWYDPSNGMVSTDQDCPLFTPLGQVWGLYPKQEWAGLMNEEKEKFKGDWISTNIHYANISELMDVIEQTLKEKNT
jgi:hypothetical protein